MVKVFDEIGPFSKDKLLMDKKSAWLSLSHAITLGDSTAAVMAIVNGADVNYKDSNGCTPLSSAVSLKNPEMVELLLKYGADVNYKDSNGCTLLSSAVSLKSPEMVELLLKYGADVNYKDPNGCTPLSSAVSLKNPEMIELLLKYGADVNYKDLNGCTPLNSDVSLQESRITNMLLRAVNGTNDHILLAVNSNNLGLLKFLIQNGYKHPLTEENLKEQKNLSLEMRSLLRTYQFLYNTGYFKSKPYAVPQQILESSIIVSKFIEEEKCRDDNWNTVKDVVPKSVLVSQLAYEYRSNQALLPYFMEVVQLVKQQLDSQEERVYTTQNHTQRLYVERTTQQKKSDSKIRS